MSAVFLIVQAACCTAWAGSPAPPALPPRVQILKSLIPPTPSAAMPTVPPRLPPLKPMDLPRIPDPAQYQILPLPIIPSGAGLRAWLAASASGLFPTFRYADPVPGVCIFSRSLAIDNSAAGKAATERMRELAKQMDAAIEPEREAFKTYLVGQKESLSPTVVARALAFNNTVSVRIQQLEDTRRVALERFNMPVQSALIAVITTRGCGIVLDNAVLVGFNPKMDITEDVTRFVDKVLAPFAFNPEPGVSQGLPNKAPGIE